MPDQEDQVEPGFALVRHTETGGVYVTKWRDDDLEVIADVDVDHNGQPMTLSEGQIDELVAAYDKKHKKPAAAGSGTDKPKEQ